jgi:hypothetical protein
VRAVSALLLCIAVCPALAAQPQSGSVCVAPNPRNPWQIDQVGNGYNPAALMFRIDRRSPIRWPRKACAKIGDLDLKEPHLITIMSDGKPYQSFHFRFSEYKTTQLCLLFDGIGLPELKDDTRYTPLCTCKEQAGTAERARHSR